MTDPIGVDGSLFEMLGQGVGALLEIGCGTGTHAARIRSLGWSPSASTSRPGCCARSHDFRSSGRWYVTLRGSFVLKCGSVMIHTDVTDYPAVLREAWRVIAPGGCFVHVGVHHASVAVSRTALIPRPSSSIPAIWMVTGRRRHGRTRVSETRSEHRTCPCHLLGSLVDAGFVLHSFREGGEPIPTVLAVRALKLEYREIPRADWSHARRIGQAK